MGKHYQSKPLPTLAADGSEIFSTLYKSTYPLNNREVIHRRLLQFDDTKQLYMINYTTMGLEGQASKNKAKYARAFHNLSGIVLRAGLFNDKQECIGTKLFYTLQMQFTG